MHPCTIITLLAHITIHKANAFIPHKYTNTLALTQTNLPKSSFDTTKYYSTSQNIQDEEVDIAIIGSGIGGLTAGAILNTLYNKTVTVLESHYLPGGCAHAFQRYDKDTKTEYTFDSGPTILLGCTSEQYPNPLQQVLNAIGQDVDWIQYYGWGMMELSPQSPPNNKLEWRLELGADGTFENGALSKYAINSTQALLEFNELSQITRPLLAGLSIPALAMRSDNWNILPLLFKYTKSFFNIISQGELVLGTFAPYMDGPIYKVTDPWLRDYLDALAFSLSGLSANRTAAAAMAFVLFDCHERKDAVLDYPKGGLGSVIDALVRGVEVGENGSSLRLKSHVDRIDFEGGVATGVTLRNGKKVRVRDGVICNAPIWSLEGLLGNDTDIKNLMGYTSSSSSSSQPNVSWETNKTDSTTFLKMDYQQNNNEKTFLETLNQAEMTGSFLHLHIVLNISNFDTSKLEPHYTVMSRSLSGEGDGPCGPLNMIALSNPCIIDPTLSPKEDCIILHAYGAANEPYELWEGMDRFSEEYKALKKERAKVLYEAVESIVPDYRERIVYEIIGSPLTHERYLRRPR